jgi:radical SAM superfamily enzyme YgiQ (UPF0313 family)
MPEETLGEDVDYVVRYEGEVPFAQLCDYSLKHVIKGLTYRVDGHVVSNPDGPFFYDLDSLPFPDITLQLLPISDPENNFGVIATSRGCPFQCTFCSSPCLWKRQVRFRSVGNVIDEMVGRREEHGVERFYINDDNFNLRPDRTIELCQQMYECMPGIRWICEAQLKNLNRGMLWNMKRAGCVRMKLGVESGSDRILRRMKKPFTKSEIRDKVRMIRDAGIKYTVYALIGMPDETEEEMIETYEFMEELDPEYISLSVVAPQPGSELFEEVRKKELFSEDDFHTRSHQSYSSSINPYVSKKVIDRFLAFNDSKGFARSIWEEE